MTTAYTSLLGLALPVTGELSGTWGDVVNNSITSLLDSAIAGTTTISADADVTLTTTTGASNTSRPAILLWTASGTTTRNITAPAQSKVYVVVNASSSTQSIVLRGAGPTTGVTIVKGEKALCAWDGSDFVKVANQNGIGNFTTVDTTNLEVTNIKAKDGTASATIADSTGIATFSGATVFTAGTAAAPAITTTGDTNTGIFFPAADTIAFSEGGVEAMRIDSSGNVGIGTSSPQSKLHINSGAGSTQFRMGTNSTSSDRALISYNSTTNRFTIDMSGNDSVIVDGSGNVGLGVTPPTSTDAGNITIKGGSTLNFSTASGNMASNATFNSGWKYIATAAAVKYTQSGAEHQWFNAASGTAGNAITFTQAMTLGSDAKLSTNAAQSGDSGASSATRTLLQQQTSGTQATAGVFTVYGIIHPSVYNVTLDSSTGSGAAAPMLFATGNTERARIDSSGNLLVGASGTANGKVHINGSVVYTVPATFSASIGANAAWTTGYGSQAINLSLWASSGIGGVSVYNVSDRRLKEQITQLTGTQALSFIEKTKPVQFVWKEEQTTDTGFIAQDILAAGFGHLVSMIPDNAVQEEIDENGNVSPAGSRFVMKYDSVIPILTAAIKEQQAIIQTLTDRITALEKA